MGYSHKVKNTLIDYLHWETRMHFNLNFDLSVVLMIHTFLQFTFKQSTLCIVADADLYHNYTASPRFSSFIIHVGLHAFKPAHATVVGLAASFPLFSLLHWFLQSASAARISAFLLLLNNHVCLPVHSLTLCTTNKVNHPHQRVNYHNYLVFIETTVPLLMYYGK